MGRGHLQKLDVNRGHEPDGGRTPNIQHRTPNTECQRARASSLRCSVFDVGRSVFVWVTVHGKAPCSFLNCRGPMNLKENEHRTPNTEHRTPNARELAQAPFDVRCSTLDVRCSSGSGLWKAHTMPPSRRGPRAMASRPEASADAEIASCRCPATRGRREPLPVGASSVYVTSKIPVIRDTNDE